MKYDVHFTTLRILRAPFVGWSLNTDMVYTANWERERGLIVKNKMLIVIEVLASDGTCESNYAVRYTTNHNVQRHCTT